MHIVLQCFSSILFVRFYIEHLVDGTVVLDCTAIDSK